MTSLEERVKNLEIKFKNLNRSILQNNKNQTDVTARTDESHNKIPQIDSNTSNIEVNSEDIITTQEGLAETYEEMNSSIIEVEEALAEVYEIVIGTDEG